MVCQRIPYFCGIPEYYTTCYGMYCSQAIDWELDPPISVSGIILYTFSVFRTILSA